MLTPLRPQPGDPHYDQRIKKYRLDVADKKANPRNWGPAGQNAAAPAVPATPSKPGRGRPRKVAP